VLLSHRSTTLIPCPSPQQGTNGTFELYLQGTSASAFTVSPTRIVGTGEVQILVQNPSAVDYEITHVIVVQVGPSSPRAWGHNPSPARTRAENSLFGSEELGQM